MSIYTKVKSLFSNNTVSSFSNSFFVNGSYESNRKLTIQAEFSWAFVAMNAIAKDVATTPLKLYKRKGDDIEEIESHEAIDALMSPNIAQTDYDVLWTTIMHQNAIGEAVWVFDEDTQES